MVPPSAHLGRARRSRWSHVCGGGAGRTTRTPETRSGGEGGVLPSHACQVQLRAAGMEWVGQSRIKGTGCRRGGCPVTPQRSPAPDAPEWTQVCTPHPRSDGPGSAFSPETLSLPSAPRFCMARPWRKAWGRPLHKKTSVGNQQRSHRAPRRKALSSVSPPFLLHTNSSRNVTVPISPTRLVRLNYFRSH